MQHSAILNDAVDSSDLGDPLAGYPPFLFKSSSSFSSNSLENPNLDSLLTHLKNMVVRNPDSLVKQAKTILEDSMKLLETDKTTVPASDDKSEAPVPMNDNIPHERRPGLGLKRAKFSAKPMPSQPDLSVEPSIDIDKLKDPDELFAAFEVMQNAKKELQRLKGQPFEEMDQNRASLPARRRRPSLLGKSATYKHRSYSLTGEPVNDEVLMFSQEESDPKIMSPIRENAIPETSGIIFSPRTRVSDVKQAMSSKVSELDELLAIDYDDYDETGIQNLLQEKLNVKLVDIGEPSLPVMPDFRRREYGSLVETLPNMKDSIFNANDNSKATSSKPLHFNYQFRKSSNNQLSPSHSQSPLASISTLNKHISRLTPLKDPFVSVDVDSSPDVISYQTFKNRKQTDQIGKRINSHEEEANGVVTSPLDSAGNSRTHIIESDERLDEIRHSDPLLTSKDLHEFGRSPACREEDIGSSGKKLPSMTGKNVVRSNDTFEWVDEIGQAAQASTSENLFEMRSPTDGEENLENLAAGAENNNDVTNAPTAEEEQIAADPKSVCNEVFSEGSTLEMICIHGGKDEMLEPLNTQGISFEKNKRKGGLSKSKRKETEESTILHQENIYEETMNKKRKGKAKINAAVSKEPKNKKRKVDDPPTLRSKVIEQQRRHSLSGAGTKWEAGVRRSTRIRMRPLEFWKGERFLYGRVHDSMVSVIGVKYASPAKNAKEPAVKVKSFVSDTYKDLIDLASSH